MILRRTGSRRADGLRLVLALVLVGAVVLLALAVQYRWEPVETVDRVVSQQLQSRVGADPRLVPAVQAVSNMGGQVAWWSVHTVTVVLLLLRRNVVEALFVAVAAGGGGLLTTGIKILVGRERPDWPEPVSWADGFAFPSGHTTGTAIGVSVLLVVLLPRVTPAWGWVLGSMGAVLVVAVAASRVVLGVHWVSDVVGGLLFAAVWMLIILVVFRGVRGKRHRPLLHRPGVA